MNRRIGLVSIVVSLSTFSSFGMGNLFSSVYLQGGEEGESVAIDISEPTDEAKNVDDLACLIKECKTIEEVYSLGISFRDLQGPLFMNDEEKSLQCAYLCFDYIIDKCLNNPAEKYLKKYNEIYSESVLEKSLLKGRF